MTLSPTLPPAPSRAPTPTPTATGSAHEVLHARRPHRRPWWRRRPVHRALVVSHRWVALVLGTLLLVITTSGAVVLYEPEWTHWANADLYTVTSSAHPMTMGEAVELVDRVHPDFGATYVSEFHGNYEVAAADGEAHPGSYVVDPGATHITGFLDTQHGFMPFMVNLHECALSCAGYTGYLSFLGAEAPVLSALVEGATWATAIFLVAGVLLAFFCVSGLVLWWPGIRRLSHGFRVRWTHSRYARDFDLHQVIGFVAIPFLLMWAVTGTSFEVPLDQAWYAVTGGTAAPADQYDFSSNPAPDGTADIGIDTAVAAATRTAAGRPVYVSPPTAEGTDGSYQVYLSAPGDAFAYGHYSGQVLVYVDRWDANHVKQASQASYPSLSRQIWENWRQGMFHYGFAVNGWWRLIWLAFGLTPLLLAVTGVSTWLYKRGVRRRKRAARQLRASGRTRAGSPGR